MRSEKGFSLIELLIVIAVILIIAAIAIPNLLRSRMAANEASAVGTLRTVSTANATYANTYNIGYAGDLNHLGAPSSGNPDSTHADLLDPAVSGGCPAACVSNYATKSGFNFTYASPSPTPTMAAPNVSFTVVGVPLGIGSTGTSSFCVDQTNLIVKDIGIAGGHITANGNGCVADGWVGASVSPI